MVRAACIAALAWTLAACSSCPPDWAEQVALHDGYHYAAGSVGELSVDVDAVDLALTRAARRLADVLGLDVEGRLVVVRAGDLLFVEARGSGADGGAVVDALAGLELVELSRCGSRTHARVRLSVR